jgi:hypothetical protein
MQKYFWGPVAAMALTLWFGLGAQAQTGGGPQNGRGQGNQQGSRQNAQQGARGAQQNAARSPWKFYPSDRSEGDGGPAPKRDLSGTWAGPGSGAGPSQFASENEDVRETPSLTPLGKQMMSVNKPLRPYSPAATNDPHVRYCDPFGFPQNMTNEIRGLQIITTPNKVVLMIQYMDLWREVWTDGRALPANVGMPGKDALDPRYNGYSVGHWEDDHNFVVDTTGLAEGTWLTSAGLPHSINAHVQERYTRSSKNDLKLTITVDDPTIYTKPFTLATRSFRLMPKGVLDEWLCIPSEVQEYLQTMGDPAGSDPSADRSTGPNR